MARIQVALALGVIAVIALATSSLLIETGTVDLYVSTTTSLYNTGLLDYLADKYVQDTGSNVKIHFIAVGSGEALERAARGDACMVFVHAPSLEAEYIEKGVLQEHRIIAYNYFVIVGPPDDPADINTSKSVIEAFRKIYQAGLEGRIIFVSRGDMSGTHVKETSIWEKVGLHPSPEGDEWYIATGQGMSSTLIIAEELGAYTLTDTGTYLKLKKEGRLPNLEILYTGDPLLLNIYSAYLVSSCAGVEKNQARAFLEYVYTHQELIGEYGIEEYGTSLFYPASNAMEWLQGEWKSISSQG